MGTLGGTGCRQSISTKGGLNDSTLGTESISESTSFAIVGVTSKSSTTYRVTWQEVAGITAFDLKIAFDEKCMDVLVSLLDISASSVDVAIHSGATYFACVFAKSATKSIPASNNGLAFRTQSSTSIVTSPTPTAGATATPTIANSTATTAIASATPTATATSDASPIFTSVTWANDAVDGYINASESVLSHSLIGALSASNYTLADYALTSSATTCDANLTYTVAPTNTAFSLRPDGEYKVCVRLRDADDHKTYGSTSSNIILDTAGPNIDAGSDFSTGASFTRTPTASNASSYQWSQTSGAGTVTFGSATNAVTTISASSDGLYFVRLTATDAAGNPAYDEFLLGWNTPLVPYVSAVTTTKTNGPYAAGVDIDIVLTFSESVTVLGGTPTLKLETGSIDQNAVYLSGSPGTALTFRYTVQAGDETAKLDAHNSANQIALAGSTILGTGTAAAALLSVPKGANTTSLASQHAIAIDTSAPTAASALITAADSAGGPDARYDDDTTIFFSWAAGLDAQSAIASYTLKRYNAAACAGGSTDTTGLTGTSQSFTGANGSTYSFEIISINGAGLTATSACSSSITIDTSAPTSASSLITAADAPAGADSRFDDDTTVYFAWTAASDAGSSIASYLVKRYDAAGCAGASTDTSGISATFVSFVGTTGHTYSFKVVAINGADLSTTSACSGDMTIDTTAPTLTGLSNDASPTKSKTWTWGCSEACTYRFSVDTTSNSTPGGGYSSTATATQATGTGTYYIHVQAMDAAGNESTPEHFAAAIDNTAPTIADVTVATSSSVDVTFSEAMSTGVTTAANYTLSGTGKGTLAATPNSVALVSGNQYRLTWTVGEMLNGGNITIAVATAQDSAGNTIAANGTHTGGATGSAPVDPTSRAWSVSSPSASLTLTATWVASTSPDLANQKIQFYSDGTCNASSGILIDLNSAVATTRTFTGTDGGDYSYKIQSIDSAGNTAYSGCSSAMHITYIAPPSSLSYSSATAVYVYNDVDSSLTNTVTSNSPSVTGVVASYAISPNLNTNTGLTFSTSTGVISGKPTLTTAATDYTVTASNGGGSTTATVNIRTGPGFAVNSNTDFSDNSTADNKCETSAGNGSVCTLRAALVQLNAMSGTPRLLIIPAYTITTGSTLTISKNIEIIGATQTTTIIDGNAGAYRVFTVTGAGMSPSMTKMTIQNSTGGGVRVTDATLTMSYVTVQNTSTSTSDGGGIYGYNPSTLILSNIKVLGNTGRRGGGIACYLNSICTITNAIVTGNATLSGYDGGGISNSGTMNLSSSYVADNVAPDDSGGALNVGSGTATITNSTFYRNTAGDRGGAITATVAVSLINCTIANNASLYPNSGYGALNGTGLFTLKNTVLTNNRTFSGAVKNCSYTNTIAASGYNLIDTSASDCNISATGDLLSTDPLLSSPADHGGWSLTMSPTTGSPLIDAGTSSGAPALDQRGAARPDGSAYDIGAYEGVAAGAAMDTSAPNNATSLGWVGWSPSATTSIIATWTVSNSGDLSSQKIQLFTGNSCSAGNRIGFPIDLGSAVTNSYAFTGTDATTYTYKIVSIDTAGNLQASACSQAMVITL